jgi:hypothetical protein
MIFSSKFACRTRCDSPSPSLNEMLLLRSATLLASSWLCHQCSHSNDSNTNKKCCFLCQAWRDGLAPLSAKGGTSTLGAAASNIGLVDDDASCHDKNRPPNNASPRRGGSPTKRGTERKSLSRELGGVLCPSLAHHVADFCERWNEVVDICNGRRGPHSPANATQWQTSLLEMLAWFSRWKELHDKRVKEKHATEYNFFADETWFCIKSLLLGHVAVMHIYYVIKGESISPRTMNTDTVEWFFGDA